uniref:Uncharacterized protein n=1 Tax=Spongospora subterranea TaxID=70186 RepID=A0A0H5QTL0_9EUKA|eukprot:CRZ05067.1 hypothetical protein [Spongospora subterranea]
MQGDSNFHNELQEIPVGRGRLSLTFTVTWPKPIFFVQRRSKRFQKPDLEIFYNSMRKKKKRKKEFDLPSELRPDSLILALTDSARCVVTCPAVKHLDVKVAQTFSFLTRTESRNRKETGEHHHHQQASHRMC